MSFILDALKKSENARQRQIGPAMAELPRRRRQSERPWWAFAVAALLLVNIGVLILVLTRNKGEVKPVAAAAAAPVTTFSDASAPPQLPADSPTAALPTRATQPAPQPGNGNGATSSLADEAALPNELDGDGGDPLIAGETQQAPPPTVRPIQAPAVAPLPNAAPAAPQTARLSVGNEEVLPTVGELSASGRSFPPMRLDIHSFADKASDRFVFVNMRRYGEGQTLQEGPAVERITQEGVILNQQGLRFMLPRP